MKIGFDISQTEAHKAGCGYFADSLIQEIAMIDSVNRYLLYKTFGDSFWTSDYNTTRRIEQHNFREGLFHSNFDTAKLFWQDKKLNHALELGSPDIIHTNNFFCPSMKIEGTKLIYTLYDLSFILHPEWTTEANRIVCLNGVLNASLFADFIIAISEYSRQSFLSVFPYYPADKVKVVYPSSRFSNDIGLPTPERFKSIKPHKFWLSVGTIEPRKNQQRLLEAYAKLNSISLDVPPLIFAGGKGWMMNDFEMMIERLGLQDKVILLGYVEDNELQWLYQNCFAFIYPSLFEGFGLPVLEAMVLGAMVIASNISSIPEIMGEIGIYCDPLDIDSIFCAMKNLSTMNVNEQNSLKEKLKNRAKIFSWKNSAKEILKIYEHLNYNAP